MRQAKQPYCKSCSHSSAQHEFHTDAILDTLALPLAYPYRVDSFQMPDLIDPDTPDSAKTRTGFDGQAYELVFSDEFTAPGRTFYPGDDPFWEAVDLWYGSTGDQEWYDPAQVTTRDGYLAITMDAVDDITLNHGLPYKSGMLQSWNKFCFTSGYIEVSITLPGPNSDTKGYVSKFCLLCVLCY